MISGKSGLKLVNILFVVPSYRPAYGYGGTIVVTALLAENLVKLGHTVTVFTTTANGRTELNVKTKREHVVDGVVVRYFRRVTGDHTHTSPSLWRHLRNTIDHFDVVHIHSWWNPLVIGAAWICKTYEVKPILSSHGMFSDYILATRNSRLKQLTQKVVGLSLLRNTFLHVSTDMELEEARRIIPDWPATVIPNLVELPELTYERKANDVFTIGFLSRIDPKKGLDILIGALGKVDFSYRLLVAGDGDTNYIDSLKQMAIDNGTSENIEWIGWKNGDEKFDFMAGLDLFALISHSENFAIVVIESLSVGTPVLISDQVGLNKYVRNNDVGWICERDLLGVASKLKEIYVDKQKLVRITGMSESLIKNDFDAIELTHRYVRYYEKVVDNQGKPGFA
ncbi:glycosyltransferase [soil metagenome]